MLGDTGRVLQPHHGKARVEKDVKCSNTGDPVTGKPSFIDASHAALPPMQPRRAFIH